MFHREERHSYTELNTYMNCVACGSTNLIEGKILDESGGTKFTFKPLAVSMWKAVFGIGVQQISATACVHSGHLQRYIEFEGRQPALLERIESE